MTADLSGLGEPNRGCCFWEAPEAVAESVDAVAGEQRSDESGGAERKDGRTAMRG